MIFHTDRLTLRKPLAADWSAFQDFAMSPRAAGIGGPLTPRVAWRQFAAEIGHWVIRGYGMFAVTQKGGDDTPLGMIGPWFPDDWPEREIGWMLFPAAEGKSIGYEAASACLSYLRDDLGWKTVVSYIGKDNQRSCRLAQRLGAKLDPNADVPDPQNPCLVYRHSLSEDL